MKRLVRTLGLTLVALFFLLPCAFAKKDNEIGQVTGSDVNLRAEPTTDSDTLGTLALNDQVEVLGRDDGWLHVIAGERLGYVREDYVFILASGARVAYVIEDGVKLRGGPGQSSYIITELAAGSGVKVKRIVGEWYFVTSAGETGYVHKNYLRLTRSTTGSAANEIMLARGMEGEEVQKMQRELARRGFLFESEVTGTFGPKTREAVKSFQKAAQLAGQDGIAGPQTLSLIYDQSNGIKKSLLTKLDYLGRVTLLDWFKGGSEAFGKGTRAVVHDVETGLEFRVRRFGGWYHADCEPVSAKDSDVFKKVAGGKWTWDRRAIWLKIGNKVYAASMNCMPHLPDVSKGDNFPGHFCIHFQNSKVHENSKVCPRHQAMVRRAFSKSQA